MYKRNGLSQARSQVLRFGGTNYILGVQEFCYNYMLKTVSWRQKNFGVNLPRGYGPAVLVEREGKFLDSWKQFLSLISGC